MSSDDTHDHDHDFEDAARALETRETLEGTFSIKGETYPLVVEEPTLGELEDLEDDLDEDADEEAVIREMVENYLVDPEVNANAVGVSKLRPLFEGMQEAFQDGDAFEAAEAEMPLDEGN